jgi:hypothetical protein
VIKIFHPSTFLKLHLAALEETILSLQFLCCIFPSSVLLYLIVILIFSVYMLFDSVLLCDAFDI